MQKKQLGNLEEQVMNIVWQKKTCSIKDVHAALKEERPLAYTTVATMLDRLCEKGLVTKKEKNNIKIYTANLSKDVYTKKVATSFLRQFVDLFGDTAVASFIEGIDKLPEEKRDNFLQQLEVYIKHGKQ